MCCLFENHNSNCLAFELRAWLKDRRCRWQFSVWCLRSFHHVPVWLFLENHAEGVSSSASAQHQLAAAAALGRSLADTTSAASHVLFEDVYCSVLQLSESVSNLCCKFILRQQDSTHCAIQQMQVLSAERKCEQMCVHIVNQHENPTMRHNRYFNIAIVQRQHKQYMLHQWDLQQCHRPLFPKDPVEH